jgi:SAM-dependent methyltransferase
MIETLKALSRQAVRDAKTKVLGVPLWEQFQNGNWSEGSAWSNIYRVGKHRSIWDHSFPSPELIGYISSASLDVGARVLDAGCGSGRDAIFLAGCGFETHGLDFSAEALDIARGRDSARSVNWHHGSMLKTPFPAQHFDLITDRGCLHHIGGARRVEYAKEIARILKPGGILFLRGCRRPLAPFFPINPETIAETFDADLFEIGRDIPFFLVVDGGGLEATLATIVRRP